MIYALEQYTYIPFTCTRQIRIERPLSLHYMYEPWLARQIKMAWPLGLHYIARPLSLHYNHYVSLTAPLVCTKILHDPYDIHLRAIYLYTLYLYSSD